MKALRDLLRDLAPAGPLPDVRVSGLSLDSRRVAAGEAYLALPGENTHGVNFVEQARAAGAAAVLCDPAGLEGEPPAGVILVPDLAERQYVLARRMWDDPCDALAVIGITGTNGKSSCAWMLAAAMRGAMIGTLGVGRPGDLQPATHTTPDVLTLYRTLAQLRDRGESSVALEVSSHALVQGRVRGLAFQAVVFTNLTHDHLDYHGHREAYGAAKARLFTDYPAGLKLINCEDTFGRQLMTRLAGDAALRAYGWAHAGEPPFAGVRVLAATRAGMQLEMRLGTRRGTVELPMLGAFNALNALAVAAVMEGAGLELDEIAARLGALPPVPGRMNRLAGGGRRADVVIDYAHTPDALQRALEALVEVAPGEVWCVFGCGGERDRGKRAKMGAIAEKLADHVVLTDDNPRGESGLAIVREIQGGMARPDRARVIRDRAAAIQAAVSAARPDDIVLVAGKGHETEQVIGNERHPFSDFDAVRRALEAAA